jgi:hypothetical protein
MGQPPSVMISVKKEERRHSTRDTKDKQRQGMERKWWYRKVKQLKRVSNVTLASYLEKQSTSMP